MATIYCSSNMSTVLLLFIQLFGCGWTNGRIYQTKDAIIIEDVDYLAGIRQHHQVAKDLVHLRFQHPSVFGEQTSFPTYASVQSVDFPAHTNAMATSTCLKIDGQFGSCTSIQACYPRSQLSEEYPLTQLAGSRSSCSYVDKDGKQSQGICCSVPMVGDDDAVTGSGHRTLSMVTANRYDGFVTLSFLALHSYYPYWRVVGGPVDAMATKTSFPVKQMASGQGDYSKQTSCGAGPFKTLSIDDQRIVGGYDAIKNSWPGIVALKMSGRLYCSGSLISSDKILTAAHCIPLWIYLFPRSLTVELGVHTVNPSDAQVTRKVSRIFRHRLFSFKTLVNDIAILRLDSPVTFTSTISPVCLPSADADDQSVDSNASVIGWGSTQEGGKMASVLQQATVQIVANAQCQKQYAGVSDVVDAMLCASAPGKDTCQGDSGGPLLVQSAPGSPWTQAGIVSFGLGCADPRYPGVYTRVASYSKWIQKHI